MTHSLFDSAFARFALGLSLSLAACSAFDGQPLTTDDLAGNDPEARPAAGPASERIGQVQLPIEPTTVHPSTSLEARTESTSDVLSPEQTDLVGERMAFQSQVSERLQRLDARLAAVSQKLTSEAYGGSDVNALLRTYDETRRSCVKAQDALVITSNEGWSDAKEQLVSKLDALDSYVAKLESSVGGPAGPSEP